MTPETVAEYAKKDFPVSEWWGELDAIDEGGRIPVDICVLDLKRIREAVILNAILKMKRGDE